MHGHGVYSHAGGARFDGNHERGVRQGEGTLTLRDGTQLGGIWVEGELRGTGSLSD